MSIKSSYRPVAVYLYFLFSIRYLKNFIKKDELKEHLSFVYDIERLCARIAYGSANPKDIQRLVKTLQHVPQIFDLFKDCESYQEFQRVDTCQALLEIIDGAIVEDVIVEHPLYGEIRAMLMIKNMMDIENFYDNFKKYEAEPLSTLTNGVHLHTIICENDRVLSNIVEELNKKGFLIKEL
ncbi:MAG: 3H domain-containing protein [Oscillospiraceae bacterium]